MELINQPISFATYMYMWEKNKAFYLYYFADITTWKYVII